MYSCWIKKVLPVPALKYTFGDINSKPALHTSIKTRCRL